MWDTEEADSNVAPMFAARYQEAALPRWTLAEHPVPPRVARQVVEDERMLDANPRMNLASFVTTWLEPEARQLMDAAVTVNLADQDQYPATKELELRCVSQLAALYHAPTCGGPGVGTSTVGSSEAIMLCSLALKFRWRKARQKAGTDASQPNIVMGSNVQVVWERFCLYFDVEPRMVDVGPDSRHLLDPAAAAAAVDENTIAVVTILGSTYTGGFEDIKAVAEALENVHHRGGPDVPIHVDAASGGFVAPFLDPELEWDFRVARVASINVSSHKYGMTPAGCGFAIFRDESALPEELIFETSYLGSDAPVLPGINFSRSASGVVAQYYNLVRLGFQGYKQILSSLRTVANTLAASLVDTGRFELLSDGVSVPVVAFALHPQPAGWDEFSLADKLREHGWILPAYRLPQGPSHGRTLLRVVVREDFSLESARRLVRDVVAAVSFLDHTFSRMSEDSLNVFSAVHAAVHLAHKARREKKKHAGNVC